MNWDPADDHLGERWWLQPGEQLQWEGAPDPRVIFSKQDLVLVPFSMLWTGFAFFWEAAALSGGWLPGGVFGLPIIAIGLYMVFGRFFYKRWDRRRTRYVVTNRRALVLRSGGRKLQEAPILTAPMKLESSRDGQHGSVIWSLDAWSARQSSGFGRWNAVGAMSSGWLIGSGWPGAASSRIPAVAFLDVTDFDLLLGAVNRVRADASAQTSAAAPAAAWPPPPPPPPFSSTTWSPPEPPPTSTASWSEQSEVRGRPGRRAGTAVLLFGLVVAAVTATYALPRANDYLNHPPQMSAPGSSVIRLESGTYVLFEHPSSPRVPSDCPVDQCAIFGPSDVEVVGTSGLRPVVTADLSADRLSEAGLTYRGIVEFDIAKAGSYRIVVRASAPGRLLIDPSPGQEVRSFAPWIALGAFGLMAILIGVILIFRARLRRRALPIWPVPNG